MDLLPNQNWTGKLRLRRTWTASGSGDTGTKVLRSARAIQSVAAGKRGTKS
jgi:hypothetical protein